MSIEKDVEEMYRKDMEKRNKNKEKKKFKKIIALILFVVLIIILLIIFNSVGLGFGGKKGNNNNESTNSQNETSTQEETTTTTIHKEFVYIQVSGSAYIYDGNVTTVDSFVNLASQMKENVVIMIVDDNATKNAMDELVNALANNGREYSIEQTDNSSSAAENSQLN